MLEVCELLEEAVGTSRIKGDAAWVFSGKSINALSDGSIDVQAYNAVSVEVLVTGTGPSATITILGAPAAGATFLPLPDPNATQTAVTASKIFDVQVGASFLKVQLSDISGSYTGGDGWTIIVTPYIAFGSSNITAVVS